MREIGLERGEKRGERHEWEVFVQDGWMKREERDMSGKCLYKMDG